MNGEYERGWNDAKAVVFATLKEGYPLVDGDTAMEMVARLNEPRLDAEPLSASTTPEEP